jgi:hypothetical protein
VKPGDTLVASAMPPQTADLAIEALTNAARILRGEPRRRGSVVWLPARGRLLVTGDLHDNPDHLRKILSLAGLERGTDHHVVFQEIIHSERLVNGVDLSHRMLVRVAELVIKWPGQVHVLLANHELSQMTNMGVSKGAGDSVELFNKGLQFAFGDHAADVSRAIDAFIRAMPLALRSESGIFCAHSLPSPMMMEKFDETIFDREPADADYTRGAGAAYMLTWGRGQTKLQIEELAARWRVRIFFLGHEHIETGCEMFGPRLVKLNSDHEQGAVLPVDLANPPSAEEAIMSAIKLGAI